MKRHEQARLYLRKAAEDETLLDEVIDSPRVSDAAIGFHCQQAAEKLLKALLSYHGMRFRRTHDLRELMDFVADSGREIPISLLELDSLTPFAVEFRYDLLTLEGEVPLDRARARKMLRELRAWVEDELIKNYLIVFRGLWPSGFLRQWPPFEKPNLDPAFDP